MTTHDHHLTNLDAADLPRYEQAIDASGRDLSIRPGSVDCHGRLLDANRYSLWCATLEGDLSGFWRLVEQE